eukprot:COSAG02_NODE_64871_length_259_cov_0.881250_1_plen_27_part_10
MRMVVRVRSAQLNFLLKGNVGSSAPAV